MSHKGRNGIMKAHKGDISQNLILVLIVVLVSSWSTISLAASEVSLANGITAVVFSAEEITADPDLCAIDLVDDDRTYFPFETQTVLDALETMQGFETAIKVQVFLLPSPPEGIRSSYASQANIYLAPGIGRVPAATVAYITTHEMGHVLTWAFLDGDSQRWDAYMALRGLDPVTNGPSARHADRAREILAEDFRFLFGGSLAVSSGSIENHDLLLPTMVMGLEDLLVEFLAGRAPVASVAGSRAFPNPCNPRTTVALSLVSEVPLDANQAVLRIFDIRGSLVKTVTGGQLNGNQIEIPWQGDDEAGAGAASGRYLYVMQVGQLQATGSVTLVR